MTAARTLLHLIRHADALPPEAGDVTLAGYEDLPLSAKGTTQATALAARLTAGSMRPVALYASPTLRARETAATLARALGVDVTDDVRLREMFLGPDASTTLPPQQRAAAVRVRLEELAVIAIRDGSWSKVPGSEPGSDVRARMADAIDEIVARHAGQHVALISHAGSINAYLAEILGMQRDFNFPLGNTSLSTVRFFDGRSMIVRVNDTAHLETASRT